jgi:hypothetical protein
VRVDKVTLGLLGAVLGLVAAGLIVAVVVQQRAASPDPSTPSGVVLAYVQAEQRGDALGAWNLLASSAQARGSRDWFLARAGTSEQGEAFFTIEDARSDDAGASVVLVRTTPGSVGIFGNGSYSSRTTVRLVQEGGGWRISVPPDDYLLLSSPGVKR